MLSGELSGSRQPVDHPPSPGMSSADSVWRPTGHGEGADREQGRPPRPISIAIFAIGGEGGGVLADWIVDLAEHADYVAQATSVAGVAQRTGSTLYYLEIFPRPESEDTRMPVFALMPTPGDVDIVIASELMEAARAVKRGFVTPDRTTLIASTHRVLSIEEKSVMAEGMRDSSRMERGCARAARTFIRFDMAEMAERTGSAVSAVLFGALSRAGVLPFSRQQFEDTIRRSGYGVDSSLKAFAAGHELASGDHRGDSRLQREGPVTGIAPAPLTHRNPQVVRLLVRLSDELPEAVRLTGTEGVRRLLDYQDPEYAELYLDRIKRLAQSADDAVLEAVARHLALWMSYEDTIRVADLKTRSTRFNRVRAEVRPPAGSPLAIAEYMHPRLEEICDTVPAWIGRRLLNPGLPRRILEKFTTKGRVVRTSSLGGFLLLYAIAWMRHWRRSTLRYVRENEQIERWLDRIARAVAVDQELAVEIARCQRLVKGYGDTHERGSRNFSILMQWAGRLEGRADAAVILRELHEAALADEAGTALKERLEALEGMVPSPF